MHAILCALPLFLVPPPEPVDRHGDALPKGALQRLGTLRWRHDGNVMAVACSADGKLLVSAGTDRTIRLWDVTTGQARGAIAMEDEKPPVVLAINPQGDRVAYCGLRKVVLCELPGGKLHRTLECAPRVNALCFHPKAPLLAAACENSEVRLWDTAAGKLLSSIALDEKVTSLAMAPDGKTLYAASAGGTVHVIDLATSKPRGPAWKYQDGSNAKLAIAPDGKMLALVTQGDQVGGPIPRIVLRELPSGKERHVHVFEDQHFWNICLTFSGDSKFVVVTSSHPFDPLWLYDVQSGKMRALRQAGGGFCVTSVPGTKAAIVGCGSRLERWSLAEPAGKVDLSPSTVDVAAMVLSPQGDLAAIVEAASSKIQIWNTTTGERVHLLGGDASSVGALAFCNAGKALAAIAILANGDREMQFWHTATGKLEKRVLLSNGAPYVFSADGNMLAIAESKAGVVWNVAIADKKGGIDIWNVATGTKGKSLTHKGQIRTLSFSPDNRLLAVLNNDGNLFLHNVSSAKGKHFASVERYYDYAKITLYDRLQLSPDAWLLSTSNERLQFSPDGLLLFTSVGPHTELWDVLTGQRIWTTTRTSASNAFDYTADGRGLLLRDRSGALRLMALGTWVCHELPPGDGTVTDLCTARNAKTLLTAHSATGTVLVWSTAALLAPLRATPSQLSDQELTKLWAALASGDAKVALQARLNLTAQKAWLPFLRKHLKPVPSDQVGMISQWIQDLDSPSYKVRTQAMSALEKLDDIAELRLRALLEANPSLEMRRRIELLLDKLENAQVPKETLQKLQAIYLLQMAGGAEAREILQTVAAGAPFARVTVAAQAALARMK